MPASCLLEIAVASVERAQAAQRAGAHRLELCANLDVGGLTPNIELVRAVRSTVTLPIHVLVRPRPGNFAYNPAEFAQMEEAIKALRSENVQGIVTGALLEDASVNVPRTRALVALASPMQVTFHRAFDETKDLAAALEDIVLAGAHRILTSGGAADAPSGASSLLSLIQQAGDRITVLPGGGLHPDNIAAVASATGASELHTGLGGVVPYSSNDMPAFESAIKECVARLQE